MKAVMVILIYLVIAFVGYNCYLGLMKVSKQCEQNYIDTVKMLQEHQ